MNRKWRRRLAKVGLAAATAVVVPACNETHSQRCNEVLVVPNLVMEAHGWHLECVPQMPDKRPDGTLARGWTDSKTKTVNLWPDDMPDDRVLIHVAWHELGHVLYGSDERTAELFSWCKGYQAGTGYALQPWPSRDECGQFEGWDQV